MKADPEPRRTIYGFISVLQDCLVTALVDFKEGRLQENLLIRALSKVSGAKRHMSAHWDDLDEPEA